MRVRVRSGVLVGAPQPRLRRELEGAACAGTAAVHRQPHLWGRSFGFFGALLGFHQQALAGHFQTEVMDPEKFQLCFHLQLKACGVQPARLSGLLVFLSGLNPLA